MNSVALSRLFNFFISLPISKMGMTVDFIKHFELSY